MNLAIIILCILAASMAIVMLLAKTPIPAALGLLGVLICTAGIYGLMGEHLLATLQLVVYAGAIMVLFIFSIMLLNLNVLDSDYKKRPLIFAVAITMGLIIFAGLSFCILQHFQCDLAIKSGPFTPELIKELGGNTKVIAHALFSKYYISFEAISLALLTGLVAAVVLAKRKID